MAFCFRVSSPRLLGCSDLIGSSAPAAIAQDVKGSVRGTVTDEQGAAVAGAGVTASDPSTGFSRTTNTGADGV